MVFDTQIRSFELPLQLRLHERVSKSLEKFKKLLEAGNLNFVE